MVHRLLLVHFFYALIQIFDLANKGYRAAFQIFDLGNATAKIYCELWMLPNTIFRKIRPLAGFSVLDMLLFGSIDIIDPYILSSTKTFYHNLKSLAIAF